MVANDYHTDKHTSSVHDVRENAAVEKRDDSYEVLALPTAVMHTITCRTKPDLPGLRPTAQLKVIFLHACTGCESFKVACSLLTHFLCEVHWRRRRGKKNQLRITIISFNANEL